MTPLQAAYEVAHHGRRSLTELARLLKKSPTTLAHELRPPVGSAAKLGLETAMRITDAQDDDRILQAWAEARGYRLVRVGAAPHVARCDLLTAAARFTREVGEALSAESVAAGKNITESEVARFEREVADIAPAAIALAERMRALATEQARARATTVAMPHRAPTIRRAVSAGLSV